MKARLRHGSVMFLYPSQEPEKGKSVAVIGFCCNASDYFNHFERKNNNYQEDNHRRQVEAVSLAKRDTMKSEKRSSQRFKWDFCPLY